MACQNCYNGCAEIVSDRCVRYTGIDIPSLGISTGDPLSSIEQSLSTFLISALNGTGIHPVIDPDIICNLVGGYLPDCGDLTIVDFVNALIKSTCDLQEQVIELDESVAAIEADYTVGCLTGVVASSGTHAIVQAVITKLCATSVTLTALSLSLSTNYSSNGAQLDAYIANYLVTHGGSSTLKSNKMIEYIAYPYFGTLTGKFDATGAGLPATDWVNIYLCNGLHGTPDMRGYIPVGATTMGTITTDPRTAPGGANPTYTVAGPVFGYNSITLDAATVPNHTHTATGTATQATHYHYEFNTITATGTGSPSVAPDNFATYQNDGSGEWMYRIRGTYVIPTLGKTGDASSTAITINSITVAPTAGGGSAHSNIQPSIASYYIMYIP